MYLFVTEIKAIDPKDGEIKTYCGPEVPGLSFTDAQNHCNKNGLGYCKVIGKLVSDIAVAKVVEKTQPPFLSIVT